MNNQNTEQQNSSWRQANYLQESRNQSVSRPDNYYPHYPSSQIVNDILSNSYVYPGILPPFRHGQFNLHQFNDDWNPPYAILNNENYSKYYNKSEPFNSQNTPFPSKNFPNPNHFYDKHPEFRPSTPYDDLKLQKLQPPQSPSHPPLGYLPPNFLRNQRPSAKPVIIIPDSDEEDKKVSSVLDFLRSAPQKQEQKPLKQVPRGIQLQQKMNETPFEMPQKPKEMVQKPKEMAVHSHCPPIDLEKNNDPRQMLIAQKSKIPQPKPYNYGFQDKYPNFNVPMPDPVPLEVIMDFYNQIMHELEEAPISDLTVKLFLKLRMMEARAMGEQSEQKTTMAFNMLNIFRTFILFEMERNAFIENTLSERIFSLETQFRHNGKDHFRQTNVTNYSDLYKKNPINLITRFFPKNIKEDHIHDYKNHSFYQPDYNRNPNYPKTKKISKPQSSENNSEEVSYNGIRGKYNERLDQEPNHHQNYSLKLRDRKKKKNKRNHNDKFNDQKYNREKPSERENSKPQKQFYERDNHKKNDHQFDEDEHLAIKIKNWCDKTVLADAIEQKHKKSLDKEKPKSSSNQFGSKNDPFKVIKKDDTSKKNKERSTKASQSAFDKELTQKINQAKEAKTSKQIMTPNLITFSTSNNLTEVEKQEYQRELNHLTKQMRNNDNHGKIRIGKEYFQAKMPNFIDSPNGKIVANLELRMLIKEKREKLMERKMTVLTF